VRRFESGKVGGWEGGGGGRPGGGCGRAGKRRMLPGFRVEFPKGKQSRAFPPGIRLPSSENPTSRQAENPVTLAFVRRPSFPRQRLLPPPGVTLGCHGGSSRGSDALRAREFWALRGRGGTGTIPTVLFGGEPRQAGRHFNDLHSQVFRSKEIWTISGWTKGARSPFGRASP
jgi:hypothetical protein